MVLFLCALAGGPSQGATLTVTTAANGGAGSLRQAIIDANTNANHDTVVFNISGGGVKTITPSTEFPQINFPVTLDATTQPGYSWATPMIQLTKEGGLFGFDLRGGSNYIKGFVINRFRTGIQAWNGGSNRFEANFIGTDPTGKLGTGIGDGIGFLNSANNVIGGANAAARNILSASTYNGIAIAGPRSTNNLVIGNYIGLDATGERGLQNVNGILLSRHELVSNEGGVSGTTIISNVVSGSLLDGIQMGFGAKDNRVFGNTLGLTASGNLLLPNGAHGVGIYDSTNNKVGGALAGMGNLISGNGNNGVYIGSGVSGWRSSSNRVQGNRIGSETMKRGNLSGGITIAGGDNNLVGGYNPGEGNVIAYNGSNLFLHGHAVLVKSGTNNGILGNSIYANAGRAIDLGDDSFDVNDKGDGDEGPNRRQNHPVVTGVKMNFPGQTMDITWTMHMPTNTETVLHYYRVEYFSNERADPSGFGEAKTFLGYADLTAVPGETVEFTSTFPMNEKYIAVTATETNSNNTSELSMVDTDGDAIADAWEERYLSVDVDNDGVADSWSNRGIDYDEDGVSDLIFSGADPLHKDIFVEIDTMFGRTPDMHHMRIAQIGTFDPITGASRGDGFENAPLALVNNPDGKDGINLHLELDEVGIPSQAFQTDNWAPYDEIKAAWFGTAEERAHPKAVEAKRLIYHYCLFADRILSEPATGGMGEIEGDDLVILMDQQTTALGSDNIPAAFMHELGHNLGLGHGGDEDNNYKPNYHSLMNYLWAYPSWYNADAGWLMDYSRDQFSDLNEHALSETGGLGSPSSHAQHMTLIGPRKVDGVEVDTRQMVVKEHGFIDFNQNNVTDDTLMSRDIDYLSTNYNASVGDLLEGAEDWSRLKFYFRENRDGDGRIQNTQDLPANELADLGTIGTDTGLIQFGQRTLTMSETGLLAQITVHRIFEDEGNVSVAYSTSNLTATAAADYRATNGMISFSGNETVKTISIVVTNDSIGEREEYFRVHLRNPTGGARLGSISNITVAIVDDDSSIRYAVINTNNTGVGSLRQAMLDANAAPGLGVIEFNIPAPSGLTIYPSSTLPTLTDPVIIDGRTQPGFSNGPLIEISGASAGANGDGLRVAGGQSAILALIINRFTGSGINVLTNDGNTIEGCYLGLNRQGTLDQGQNLHGIFLQTRENVVGGTNLLSRNFIAGNNGDGIRSLADRNVIQGNVIGLAVDGSDQGNGSGLYIQGTENQIGGSGVGEWNVISGNDRDGILLVGQRHSVLGNRVGTDMSGFLSRPNGSNGIVLNSGYFNVIGGKGPRAGNLISGNGRYGLQINNSSTNTVIGNWIGTGARGSNRLGNSRGGILMTAASQANNLGGQTGPEANTVAYNNGPGVYVFSPTASGNRIRGNSIFSNSFSGIDLEPIGQSLNDTNDLDIGANGQQNSPVLTAATNTAAGTLITGYLDSRSNTVYVIDFYSAPDPGLNESWGQGQFWIGSHAVTAGPSGRAEFAAATTATYLRSRFITATATAPDGSTSEFSLCVKAGGGASNRTFMVENTLDSGPGSLRQAILDSNAYISERDTIQFNIPGSGVQTIQPLSMLPGSTDPVIIDGYTQPGAFPNTSPTQHNGNLLIELDGAFANALYGLEILGGNSIVRGLVINRFGDGVSYNTAAIHLHKGSGNRVEGCFIGTDPTGMLGRSNYLTGIRIGVSTNNVIGGVLPGQRNVVSATSQILRPNGLTTGSGITIVQNGDGNRIEGNFIGTAADGVSPLGNKSYGIDVSEGPRRTIIGGTNSGAGNIIAFNGSYLPHPEIAQLGAGITDLDARANRNNAVLGNSIHSNVGLAIDGDLVNSPHPGNFPFLSSAFNSNGNLVVQGRLQGFSNQTHRIEMFANEIYDLSGHGEGKRFLGWTNVTTDANGYVAFTARFALTVTNGSYLAATSTDEQNNTSEFSPRLVVGGQTTNVFTVNSANNVDDGKADAVHTSLREAIFEANNQVGPATIRFGIGTGARTIFLTNTLPAIMDAVTLDATTQPGFAGKPLIYLNGGNVVPAGLRLYAPSNTVRGFVINWYSVGIYSDGTYASSVGFNIVEGNYIGIEPSGLTNGLQTFGIQFWNRCVSNRIGGLTVAARNVISGNQFGGISIYGFSDGNIIQGNYIGVDARGTNLLGNGWGYPYNAGGINVEYCKGTIIGGSAPGARNIISGNDRHDLMSTEADFSLVESNYFGTDYSGSFPLRSGGGSLNGVSNILRNNLGGYFGSGGSFNRIENNLIGTDATGRRPGRGFITGVSVNGVSNSVVGNVIGGGYNGMELQGFRNTVQNNRIGVDIDGTAALGNWGFGIRVEGSGNLIGGEAGRGNIIAFNTNGGIHLLSGTNNAITGNAIFSNEVLGIDIGGNGISPNDTSDVDGGPNQGQNFPLLASARNTGAGTLISGALNSRPFTSYRIELYTNQACHPSGYGEGRYYVGSFITDTDVAGNSSFSVNAPALLHTGAVLSATAIDPENNTSEFSPCTTVIQDQNYVAVQIRRAGSATTISWPTWSTNNVLERTTNLAPPIAWQVISAGITTNSGYRTYTETNVAGIRARFYRLKGN